MLGATLLLALLVQEPPSAQEGSSETTRIELDFSDQYKMLSDDLEKALRWKKLFRIFGVSEVHIFPGRESGPGPPLRIWGHGFGTSLWRDPVTGWPLQ